MGVSYNDSFPDDKYPTCWSDDVRMNALFAPFRLKVANPESWEMKVKFWSDMLRQWCKFKNDPVISANDARLAFQRKGRTPACIEIVVEECLQKGELSPISKYLQIYHHGREGWLRWGARMAFKPAALAVTTLGSFLPFKKTVDQDGLPKALIDPGERFVLESAVKEQATKLLSDYPSDLERIGTIEELMMNSNYATSQCETFELLLGYLISQGLATKKGDVIKLGEPGQKVIPIQESDEALHRLLASERKLITDAEKFTKEADRALDDARAALKLGNKVAARSHLKRKHRCLERAAGSQNALENVRHLIHTMRQTEVNATVVDTYRMSSEALKHGLQENKISEDSAHETMDELKEVMTVVNSLQPALEQREDLKYNMIGEDMNAFGEPKYSKVLNTYNEVEKALSGNIDDSNIEDLENELKELLAQPPPPPGGGATDKQRDKQDPSKLTPAQRKIKKVSEREFIFDGEERMIAELNKLSVEDNPLDNKGAKEGKKEEQQQKKKTAVAVEDMPEDAPVEEQPSDQKDEEKPSKPWYPPQSKFMTTQNNPWQYDRDDNLEKSINDLYSSYNEVNLDERLHPGQKLDIKARSGPKLYNKDFQVQDHKVLDGIWLYNTKDNDQNQDVEREGYEFSNSTEYQSMEEPGSSTAFQMAPGGERHKEPSRNYWPDSETSSGNNLEDLETRLKNLRGQNQ